MQRFTPEPLSYVSATFDEGCDVGIAAPGHASVAVLIRERPAPDDDEWHRLLARFHPVRREALSLEGADTALMLESADAYVIALRVAGEGRFVQLRADVFDRADALAIADALTL